MNKNIPQLGDHSYSYWNSPSHSLSKDLSSKTQSENLQNATKEEIGNLEPKNSRRYIRILPFVILLLGLLSLGRCYPQWWIYGIYIEVDTQPYGSYDFDCMELPEIQYESCSNHVKQAMHEFDFNISTGRWQLLDTAGDETRKHLHGNITILPGLESQYSDIEVKVITSSNDEADLKRLVLHRSKDTIRIEYSPEEEISDDLCTTIKISVFIRPNLDRVFDLFHIQSNILDILFLSGLNWEVYNFISHTSYGDVLVDAFRPSTGHLKGHNITVTSTHGRNLVNFVAPIENLVLQNKYGPIGVKLWPDLYAWKPLDLNKISISTVSGDIWMISILDVPWPSGDYTYRLSISTDSGNITSQAPHGSFTNYSSVSGNIRCYLRLYGTTDPNAKSEIYTITQSGNLSVKVSEAEVGERQYNPNHRTISQHSIQNGYMIVQYGDDWWGEIEADITKGVLKLAGSSLEDVEKGDNYVKAKRGKSGTSHISAHVGDGELEVKVGLQS